jgi:hypothetical protein
LVIFLIKTEPNRKWSPLMLIYKNWWLQVMIALRKSNLKCFCTCNSVKKNKNKIWMKYFSSHGRKNHKIHI